MPIETSLPRLRQIRADFSEHSVKVYQAYPATIAIPSLRAQTFVYPFKTTRMTWIKPSFLWMMYRSDWARLSNQEHVLRIEITREGFDWLLHGAVLTHYCESIHGTPKNWQTASGRGSVLVQWDPERNLDLKPLSYRTIQIGLRGEAIQLYVNKWILAIQDITELAQRICSDFHEGRQEDAERLLPPECPYPVESEVAWRLGITS